MNTKIDMQSPSEKSVESHDPQLKLPLPGPTVVSAEDQRRMHYREYHFKWRQRNKDKVSRYNKGTYTKHADSILARRNTPEAKARRSEYNRAYREKRRDELLANMKRWYYANKDHVREYNAAHRADKRAWYANNRERVLAQIKRRSPRYRFRVMQYCHRKRTTDIQYALKERLRATMNRALRRQWVEKSKRTMELVGCSVEELKAHLERQFVDGMSWETRRTWHVDHIVPLSFFDLRSVEEQKVAFNWRNLQPMFGRDNQRKNDTVPNPLPDWMPEYMKTARRKA